MAPSEAESVVAMPAPQPASRWRVPGPTFAWAKTAWKAAANCPSCTSAQSRARAPQSGPFTSDVPFGFVVDIFIST